MCRPPWRGMTTRGDVPSLDETPSASPCVDPAMVYVSSLPSGDHCTEGIVARSLRGVPPTGPGMIHVSYCALVGSGRAPKVINDPSGEIDKPPCPARVGNSMFNELVRFSVAPLSRYFTITSVRPLAFA